MVNLRKAAAIVGAFEYPARLVPDKTEWMLHADVAAAALEEAGLEPADIDAYFTPPNAEDGGDVGPGSALTLADYLGIRPRFVDETDVGGVSLGFYVTRAILAIQAGLARCALITYASTPRSRKVSFGTSRDFGSLAPTPYSFEQMYGIFGVYFYAMLANRYMHVYGTTSAQLARVAVAMRRHASLNPDAMYREPITVEDVMTSPVISSPLHRLDCCVISDGAAAIIVASPDIASRCRKAPVWVLGLGEATMNHGAGLGDWSEDTLRMIGDASDRAFEIAGVRRQDINTLMIYDAFTISVIMALEGAGFCRRGTAGTFVEAGGIDLGGPLPVNPDGGGMSSNHPGRRGLFLFVEATRQLRGEAGPRQVPKAQVAACIGTGAASMARRATGVYVLGTD